MKSWLKLFLRTVTARVACTRYWVPGWLVVAALLRGAWIGAFHPAPANDFFAYFRNAAALVHGLGYTSVPGIPTAYFPPGYPAWLSLIFQLFGVSLPAALLGNVLLQTCAVLLVYLVAREVYAESAGRIAMAVWALHPNSIAYTALLTSEHLFIPTMLLGIWLLLRARRQGWLLLPAGLLFGLGALTRPQGLLLPALYFLFLLPAAWRAGAVRRWLGHAVLVHLLLAAVVLPWMLRNARVLHRFELTTTTGWNLYVGNNPDADGTYVFTDRMRAQMPTGEDEVAIDDTCRHLGRAYIRTHPWQVLALLPRKLFCLYRTDGDGVWWVKETLRQQTPALPRAPQALFATLRILSEIYYAGMLLAFVLAMTLLIRRRAAWPSALPFLPPLIVGYFTALYLVYYGMSRYHMPMLPWMCITIAGMAVAYADMRQFDTNDSSIHLLT